MQSITSVETLHEAIAVLEIRRQDQEQALANQLLVIRDKLKPLNILKGTVGAIVESMSVNAVVGMASAYLFRKLFFRSPSGIVKKVVGNLLQFGVSILIGKKGSRNMLDDHNRNGA